MVKKPFILVPDGCTCQKSIHCWKSASHFFSFSIDNNNHSIFITLENWEIWVVRPVPYRETWHCKNVKYTSLSFYKIWGSLICWSYLKTPLGVSICRIFTKFWELPFEKCDQLICECLENEIYQCSWKLQRFYRTMVVWEFTWPKKINKFHA